MIYQRKKCKKCESKMTGTHTTYCRICYNTWKRESYLRHRQKNIDRSKRFNKNNPEIAAKRMRECRARRPEFYKKYAANYKKIHPEIYQIADMNKRIKRSYQKKITPNPLTKNEWIDIKKYQKFKCFYCNKKRKLVIEHKTPLSRGGLHNKENICASCAPCNHRKFTKTVKEFLSGKKRKSCK